MSCRLPSSISLLFREYLKVAGRGILPEECFQFFQLNFRQWAIIVFWLLFPVLLDADLSFSRSRIVVPLVRASSAPPLTVVVANETSVIGFQTLADVVPGQPSWIPDPTQPAGKALNPAAFSLPAPGVQGNYARNSLRSPYYVDQTDLALRRRFSLTERLKLDVRAEYFNVFSHPMFGVPGFNEPNTEFGTFGFGKIGTTTNEALVALSLFPQMTGYSNATVKIKPVIQIVFCD